SPATNRAAPPDASQPLRFTPQETTGRLRLTPLTESAPPKWPMPSVRRAASIRSAETGPYVVERCRAGRPAAAAICSSPLIALNDPFSDPAIRLMVSSISVPPRSLTPPRSTSEHSSSPSLTGALDVGDRAVQQDAGKRVHRPVLPGGRSRAGQPGQVD